MSSSSLSLPLFFFKGFLGFLAGLAVSFYFSDFFIFYSCFLAGLAGEVGFYGVTDLFLFFDGDYSGALETLTGEGLGLFFLMGVFLTSSIGWISRLGLPFESDRFVP
jgi:hypothetical protein